VRLVPLLLQLERRPGALRPQILQALAVHGRPLRPQVLAALAAHGRPLRWAITAVEPRAAGGALLQIEAVVLT